MKMLPDNPDTVQGAIAITTKEQNLRTRANLHHITINPYKSERKEEPMEVDHCRPLRCFKCKNTSHTSNTCRNVHSNDAKVKIRCWGFGKEDHKVSFF